MIQQPLFPNIGVCALVSDRWDDTWQVRHHVLSRLARYFQVVWVNPARGWREILRGSTGQNLPNGETSHPSGLTIYDPEWWLPIFYRPKWLAGCTYDARLRRARRLLTDRGCRKIVLYLWRPEFRAAVHSIPFDLSCYHIDDEYSFSEIEGFSDPGEIALISEVGQVIIHSSGLLERKGRINPNTAFVPNGVDFQAYAKATPEPHDLLSIPHPRIGYTGVLKRQLDWSLILEMTQRQPGWSFVFVGPQTSHEDILPAIRELYDRPNVYFLGRKSVQKLTAYPQHFDVCIMPYRVDCYTNSIYPLKLHEYLASGRPVVGSPIRSVRDFADVVALPSTFQEWSAAITVALSPDANAAERRAARQAVAQQHDWEILVAKIAKTMAQRLGPEFADRVVKSTG